MRNLRILKIGTEFILEAVTFTQPKNIEKSDPSIQWTITPVGGDAEVIGNGKTINYRIPDKHAGKKVTFRAFIKDDSKKKYPLQSLTCIIEKQESAKGVLIEKVEEAANKTSALVGESVEYKIVKYKAGSAKITEAQKKQIKWDIKLEGEEKKLFINSENEPFRGETIRFDVPESWSGKNVVLMPYLNQSTEKVSCKINVAALEENIIVIGTQQHNSDWRANALRMDVAINSKLMFVHQALRRVVLNKEMRWTILFCTEGYTQKQQNRIKEVFETTGEFKNIFMPVSSVQQIVNYVNTGYVEENKPIRKSGKVRRILIYAHGIVKEILPWMGPWANGDSFDIANAEKLQPTVFTNDAMLYSFACRTGLGNKEIDQTVFKNADTGEKYNLLSSERLAQKMANATNATVYAYLKRTWYGDTLFLDDDYDFMDACRVYLHKKKPERDDVKSGRKYSDIIRYGLSKEDGKRYQELKAINDELERINDANFLARGALHPVRAGETPIGLPDDMKTYKKQ